MALIRHYEFENATNAGAATVGPNFTDPGWSPFSGGGKVGVRAADTGGTPASVPNWFNSAISECSFACWVRIPDRSSDQGIVSQSAVSLTTILLWYDRTTSTGGSFRFAFLAGNTSQPPARVNGLTVIAEDTWYHVVGVMDGGARRLYVDGVLDNSSSGSVSSFTPGNFAEIAGWRANAGFDGDIYIDDLRVYDHALTLGEVQTLYNLGFPSTTTYEEDFEGFTTNTQTPDFGWTYDGSSGQPSVSIQSFGGSQWLRTKTGFERTFANGGTFSFDYRIESFGDSFQFQVNGSTVATYGVVGNFTGVEHLIADGDTVKFNITGSLNEYIWIDNLQVATGSGTGMVYPLDDSPTEIPTFGDAPEITFVSPDDDSPTEIPTFGAAPEIEVGYNLGNLDTEVRTFGDAPELAIPPELHLGQIDTEIPTRGAAPEIEVEYNLTSSPTDILTVGAAPEIAASIPGSRRRRMIRSLLLQSAKVE